MVPSRDSTLDFCVSPKETLGNIEFTESDVLKLLQNLNSSKSPGPDNMHPRILKECAQELAVPIYAVNSTQRVVTDAGVNTSLSVSLSH